MRVFRLWIKKQRNRHRRDNQHYLWSERRYHGWERNEVDFSHLQRVCGVTGNFESVRSHLCFETITVRIFVQRKDEVYANIF